MNRRPRGQGKQLLGITGHSSIASDKHPRWRRHLHRGAWIDVVLALCAAGGLTVSTLWGVQFRSSTFAGSDFKTLYASTWCFTHGMDAYSIANLQKVFIANGVVQPERWYGHAPVYPWPTLAFLSPLSLLPMVPAAYVMTIASGVLLAIAIGLLLRYSATHFDLGMGWRIAIAALCVCGPLLAFSMNMGNVSVIVAGCCVLGYVLRREGNRWREGGRKWLPVIALTVALLLKPHLGFWCVLGILLLPERGSRTLTLRAVGCVVGFSLLTLCILAATGTLGLQTHGCLEMLSHERSAGSSMSPTSHEPLPVVAQITSLNSILGFWIRNPLVRGALTGLILLGVASLLLMRTRRVNTERGALLAVGAWCSMGMLATYHRAHDAALLILLVPWAVSQVKDAPRRWQAWTATALYVAMSVSIDFPVVLGLVTRAPEHSLLSFVLLRQVALASVILLLVLYWSLREESLGMQQLSATTHTSDEQLRAA